MQVSDIICFCCGAKGHKKPVCKYKSYTCSVCSKVGHLSKVCKAKNKSKNVNNLEDCDLNLDNSFNLETINCNFVKPFCIKLSVENKLVEFQIDTGSGVTILNVKD